jgi:hypothetical protein
MSKVYNKIVQSNTEPSKNDIWLKDGQMKTFGKEGWKSVGGQTSNSDSNPYILNYTEESNAYVDKYDEILNLIREEDVYKCPNIILAYYPDTSDGGYSRLEYYNVTSNGSIILTFDVCGDLNNPFALKGKILITISSKSSSIKKFEYKEPYVFNYTDGLTQVDLTTLFGIHTALFAKKQRLEIIYKNRRVVPMISYSGSGAVSYVDLYFGFYEDSKHYLVHIRVDYNKDHNGGVVSINKQLLNFS